MSGANTVMPYVFGGLGLGHLTQQLRQDEEDRKSQDSAAITPPATSAAAPATTADDTSKRYREMRMRAYYLNQQDEGKLEKKTLLGG